jgi:hypothetical protein
MAQFYEKTPFSGWLSTLQSGLRAKKAALYTFHFRQKTTFPMRIFGIPICAVVIRCTDVPIGVEVGDCRQERFFVLLLRFHPSALA